MRSPSLDEVPDCRDVDDVFLDHASPSKTWQALRHAWGVRLFAICPPGSPCQGAVW